MKRFFKLFAISILGAAILAACGDGYKTTKDGLRYKFIECNKKAQQLQTGDVLIGTCTVKLNDSVIAVVNEPDRILMVNEPLFRGDLPEGLLMMHLGDEAIFIVEADSLAKFGVRFPDFYKPNTGMKLSYQIHLTDILSKADFEQEQSNYYENMRQIQEAERQTLEKYVSDNNINATPDNEGLYVIVNKKGTGAAVEVGKEVAINYTGRLLDGRVFDTSIETVAKNNDIYDTLRNYEPMKYKVGEVSLIRGWQKGIMNQKAGSSLTLIIPSAMAYGPQAIGIIPANSPLIFEIDILSVK